MRAASPTPFVRRLVRIDTVSGLVLMSVSAALWVQILPLEVGKLTYFGPGFLPRILTVLLTGVAVILTILGLTARGSRESLSLIVRGPLMVGCAVLVFAATIRGLSVLGLPIPRLGLFLAGPLTVLIAGLGTREARWRELVALGLGLTALATFVFCDLLSMTIPVFPAPVEAAIPHDWRTWPQRALCLLYALLALAMFAALRRPAAERAA